MARLLVSALFDPPQHEEQSTDSGQCICRQIPYSTGPSLCRMAARSGLKHSRDPHLLFRALHIDERWKMDSVCVHWERERCAKQKFPLTATWLTDMLTEHNRQLLTKCTLCIYARWVHVCVCVCVLVLIYCVKEWHLYLYHSLIWMILDN